MQLNMLLNTPAPGCILPLPAGQRELQVLDYQNVAQTLIGLTASAYACWFMGQNMQARYHK